MAKIKFWSDSDPDGDIIEANTLDNAKKSAIEETKMNHSDSECVNDIVERCKNALSELHNVGDTSEFVDDEYMNSSIYYEILEI